MATGTRSSTATELKISADLRSMTRSAVESIRLLPSPVALLRLAQSCSRTNQVVVGFYPQRSSASTTSDWSDGFSLGVASDSLVAFE
jgi:hypothetical protein